MKESAVKNAAATEGEQEMSAAGGVAPNADAVLNAARLPSAAAAEFHMSAAEAAAANAAAAPAEAGRPVEAAANGAALAAGRAAGSTIRRRGRGRPERGCR